MLQQTRISHKNPLVMKFGEGLLTNQLKHLLEKKPVYHFEWDAIPQYPARKLRHVDRTLNPFTGAALVDPARDNLSNDQNYNVPDQHFHRVPIPHRYKDAYWWRESQARRVQCPTDWVAYRFYDARLRDRYDFADLSFEEKFYFSTDDVIAHAKQERR